MLTKQDLQAIDTLIVKRVDEVVTKRTKEIVTKQLQEELAPMKQDITKMRKDMDVMLSFFDREWIFAPA